MRLLRFSFARVSIGSAGIAAMLAFFTVASRAQQDPPAEAGRLGFVSGTVSVQLMGSDDWEQAYANQPLGPGDRIYADADGRAEIQVGRTYLHIGPRTDLTLVDSSSSGIDFGLARGSLRLRCLGLWPSQALSVSTPSGNATIWQPAELRVDVFADQGTTVFTGVGGNVRVSGAGGYQQEISGVRALELAGTGQAYAQWLQPAAPDDLDNWANQQDELFSHAASFRYVNPEVPGAEELDANGSWRPGTEYGAVWFPNNVPAEWTPYHNGHWVHRALWGWVWVEDEQWGYAPFHYGRWVNLNGRWGWVPGPPAEHPVWSPALVAFVGGVNVGGAAASAWFPLGPGEPYRPWYPCSPHYVDQVNITNIQPAPRVVVQKTYVNVTNVTNITYVNRVTAVTVVKREDFAAGRPVRQAAVKVAPAQIAHLQVIAQPAAKPVARPVSMRPPARPVPVAAQRPTLIGAQGKPIVALPGKPAAKAPPHVNAAVQPRQGAPLAPPPGFKPEGGKPAAQPVTQTKVAPAKGTPLPASQHTVNGGGQGASGQVKAAVPPPAPATQPKSANIRQPGPATHPPAPAQTVHQGTPAAANPGLPAAGKQKSPAPSSKQPPAKKPTKDDEKKDERPKRE